MSESELRNLHRKARLKVLAKKGFYIHFGIFVIFTLFLLAINLLSDPSEFWFYYPVISWGVAVAIHYLVTFGIPGSDVLSEEWEQRQLEKEMYILQRKKMLAEGDLSQTGLDLHDDDALDLREPVRVKKNWDQDLV